MWKRKCATEVFNWGLWDFREEEKPRPEFKGEWAPNPITGEMEFMKAKHDPFQQGGIYLITVPIVFLSLAVIIAVLLLFLWLEDVVSESATLSFLLLLAYVLFCAVASKVYRIIAVKLNNMENYRTESDYQNHLTIKLLFFEFFNNFLFLFYTAFWRQNLSLLQQQLATAMITRQIFGLLLESLVPWYTEKVKIALEARKLGLSSNNKEELINQKKVSKVHVEAMLDDYALFDDYIKMVLQFGYICMFASAFPLASFFSVFNNLIELRSDAFKLVNTAKRPFPLQANNIGPWLIALEFFSGAAILTNLCLMHFTLKSFANVPISDETKLLAIFLLEHLILLLRWLIAVLIPDVPSNVKEQILRQKYHDQQLLLEYEKSKRE